MSLVLIVVQVEEETVAIGIVFEIQLVVEDSFSRDSFSIRNKMTC